MAIIYDSNKPKMTPRSDFKYYKVILDDRRELFMTGTSRRNINKQLDEMIERGDAFHKRNIVEISKSALDNVEQAVCDLSGELENLLEIITSEPTNVLI